MPRRGRVLLITLLLGVAGVAVVPAVAQDRPRFRPAVSGSLGVVATESPVAGRVGRDVLERGGNAVDAAVATAFAIGVARPQSCGIGGGGFLVHRSASGRADSLDFRETAPRAFRPRTLQGKGLHEDYTGHLTHGVPGTVAGMDAALRRYGTISLARAIAPAERLARNGVRVTRALAAATEENAKRLRLFPAAARQYLRRGRPLRAGSRLRQPDLARTLARIRRGGPRGFYRGRTARLLVADERAAGRRRGDRGLLTLGDLAGYRARWRRPVVGTFRDATLIGMGPPSSGGIAIQQILNLVEPFDLRARGRRSVDTLHLVAEAQKVAWADRAAYVADPRVRVATGVLVSRNYADGRRRLIDPRRSRRYRPGPFPLGGSSPSTPATIERGSTTHVSVVDRRGNAVALTCTIEQEFGSAVVAPGTGFLMNNELTDFGDPGTANQAGPGKRPRSSMSPTIAVRGGRPVAVAGGAGGSTIIMGTLWTLLDRLEFGESLARAVDAPRLDAQLEQDERGGELLLEDGRLPRGTVAGLRARGHRRFDRLGRYSDTPKIQAAGFRDLLGPIKDAVSDPRTEAGSWGQRPRAP